MNKKKLKKLVKEGLSLYNVNIYQIQNILNYLNDKGYINDIDGIVLYNKYDRAIQTLTIDEFNFLKYIGAIQHDNK